MTFNDIENTENFDDEIIRLESELEKLSKRDKNLVRMRADGEIDKNMYLEQKDEINNRILAINNRLNEICPNNNAAVEEPNTEEKIRLLKYHLEKIMTQKNDDNIPETIVSAFVKKIVVHKNRFDWYLRFTPDNLEKSLINNEGEKTIEIDTSFCSSQHRLQSRLLSN